MKLVLGSGSPRRKQILEEMGYEFQVIAPDIDEKAIRDSDPEKLVLKLANAKADAVIAKLKESAIVITADQVVYFEGKILEKPETNEEAYAMLHSYGTKPIQNVNGIVVVNTATGKRIAKVHVSKTHFKPLPEEMIKAWVKSGEAFHHCGAYAVEESVFEPYIERLDGGRDSIMGLPRELTQRLLKAAGI